MSKSFHGPLLSAIAVLVLTGFLFLLHDVRQVLIEVPPKFIGHTPLDNTTSSEIPNIVHFVHFVTPPTQFEPTAQLNFEFSHFVAIYSAYLYLQPDVIYIHTNAWSEVFSQAKESPNPWTRIVANLPPVTFHFADAPTFTTSGKAVENFAHKSDFIRTAVMKEWGGIYLDQDAYVLKDFAPLRRTGFQNVVGMEYGGQVGCAILLSTPGNELITRYQQQQDSVFDGGWITHSVRLLTTLVRQYSEKEGQVLILERNAFFPLSWRPKDLRDMYAVDGLGMYDAWAAPAHSKPTRKDWNTSYAVHGFNSALAAENINFGIFGGITLDYVLAQSSNFARAVYPAVKHALDNGVIPLI